MSDCGTEFLQWMYNTVGNREASWQRRRKRGDKIDPVMEAFEAGWRLRDRPQHTEPRP